MDQQSLAWCAFGAAVIAAILSALRPDNLVLPFSVPTRVRVVLTFVLGAVETVLQNVSAGKPWLEAVTVAFGSMAAGFALAGAPRKVAASIVVLWFVVQTAACSVFTPKRIHGAAELTKCAIENRMMAPADIAVKCGFEHVQDVVDVIAGEDQRMGTARSLGVAEGRQLGAAACPKR